jgi:hypothetical protein
MRNISKNNKYNKSENMKYAGNEKGGRKNYGAQVAKKKKKKNNNNNCQYAEQ